MKRRETCFTSFLWVQSQYWSQTKVRLSSDNILITFQNLESGGLRRSLSIFERTQIGSENLNNMINFNEIIRLAAGSSFGELALEKTGGGLRKARIQCRQD